MADLAINVVVRKVGFEAFQAAVIGTNQVIQLAAQAPFAWARVAGAVNSAGSSIHAFGMQISQFTNNALSDSVKLAAQFEQTSTKILTLGGVSAEQHRAWSEQLLQMAGSVGKAPEELANALYYVASTGNRSAEALNITADAAKASAIGMGQTADVARLLVAVVQVYGHTGLDAARATDILTAAVTEGGAEASEMSKSLGTVIGIADLLGVSFADVASYVAAYTRAGVPASQATNSLRFTLTSLFAPGNQAKQAMKSVGSSFEGVRQEIRERGLAQALVDLVAKFDGNSEALKKIIPRVHGLSGALVNARSIAGDYLKISKEVNDSGGKFGRAWAIQQETLIQKWNEFKAAIEVVAVRLGTGLLPVLKNLVDAMMPVVKVVTDLIILFGKLPTPIQVMAVLAVASIGPMIAIFGRVVMILGTFANALATLGFTMRAFGITANAASGAVLDWGIKSVTAAGQSQTLNAVIGTLSTVIGAGLSVAAAAGAFALGTQLGGALLEAGDKARGLDDNLHTQTQNVSLFSAGWYLLSDAVGNASSYIENLSGSGFLDLAEKTLLVTYHVSGLSIAWAILKAAAEGLSRAVSWLGEGFQILGNYMYKSGLSADQNAKMMHDLEQATRISGRSITDWGEALRIIGGHLTGVAKAQANATTSIKSGIIAAEQDRKNKEILAKATQIYGEKVTDLARAKKILAVYDELHSGDLKSEVKDVERAADAYKKLEGSILGREATKKLADLAKVYEQHRLEILKNKPVLNEFLDLVHKEIEAGGQVPAIFLGIAEAIGLAEQNSDRFNESFKSIIGTQSTLNAQIWKGFDNYPTRTVSDSDMGLAVARQKAMETYKEAEAQEKINKLLIAEFRARGFTNEQLEKAGFKLKDIEKTQVNLNSVLNSTVKILGYLDLKDSKFGSIVEFAVGAAQIGENLKKVGDGFKDGKITAKDWGAAVLVGAEAAAALWKATDQATVGLRVLGGALTGAQIGAAFGWEGAVAGAVIGGLVGLIHKPAWAEAKAEVARDLGISISEELAKTIAKTAGSLFGGNRSTAIQFNLADIIKGAGDLDLSQFTILSRTVTETFSFLERGQLNAAQATKVLSESLVALVGKITDVNMLAVAMNDFGVITQRSLEFFQRGLLSASQIGQIIGPAFKALTEKAAEFGLTGVKAIQDVIAKTEALHLKIKEVQDYVKDQVTKSAAGLSDVFKYLATDITTATAVGSTFGNLLHSDFVRLRAQGLSFIEIFEILGPAMDEAAAAFERLGMQLPTTLAEDIALRNLVRDHQDLIVAINGATAAWAAQLNTVGLTRAEFEEMVGSIAAWDAALKAAGFSDQQRLEILAPTLKLINDYAHQFGIELDAGTQALIDQANAGHLLDAVATPQERMAAAQEQQVVLLALIAEKFGVELPAAIQQTINKWNELNSVAGQTPIPPSPSTTKPGDNNNADGGDGGSGGNSQAVASLAGLSSFAPTGGASPAAVAAIASGIERSIASAIASAMRGPASASLVQGTSNSGASAGDVVIDGERLGRYIYRATKAGLIKVHANGVVED